MSEQEVIENVAEESAPEHKETPKPTRDEYDRIQKEMASKSGWKDFDDYIAEGGDPAKWKTADAFNTYGELIGTVKRKEQEFNQRLQGVQQLAEARLAAQREELMAKRDAAIELGDLKEVKSIEKQMNAIPVQTPQMVPGMAELQEWNAKNAWVTEKTPKAAFARELWNDLQQSGTPVVQALAVLENEVSKHFPAQETHRKTTIPETEKGRTGGFSKSTSRAITMNDLTTQEQYIYKHSGHMWKSEKEFLQSVQDSRKAEGGK